MGLESALGSVAKYLPAAQSALGAFTGKSTTKSVKVDANGNVVRSRHINPGNAKAVRRALRRVNSFHHLAMRVEKSMHKVARSRK